MYPEDQPTPSPVPNSEPETTYPPQPSTQPVSGVEPQPVFSQPTQPQPPQFSPVPVAAPKKNNKPLIFIGGGVLVLILISLGVAFAVITSKKPSTTSGAISDTSGTSNSTSPGKDDTASKTSRAKDIAVNVVRYPTLYSIDNNDTYPTKLSQLESYAKTYQSGAIMSPTKITSVPSDPGTVNVYICKTDGVPDILPRVDYWDYTQGQLVQYTGYSNTNQHILSCTFLQ